MQISARQIANIVGGEITGDPDVLVHGPSKIEEGVEGTISFLGNLKYENYLYTTNASIVLVEKGFTPKENISCTMIAVQNVYAGLAVLMQKFNNTISIKEGIADSAKIDPTAIIGADTTVDDYVIIKPGAKIGDSCKIYGHVFIGDHVVVGNNVVLYPGVKIYHNCIIGDNCIIHANAVIGSDGFGFAKDEQGIYKKIPQTGNVVLHENVEIGSNTVIDRASMGSTVIGKGSKLDNLIQIAHNVVIGENTAIAAQTGIAGSSKVGDDCLLGGQVGIVGHISIANGTMVQAQSGIASSIKNENTKLFGTPAIEYQNYLKSYTYFRKFPEIVQQLRKLQSEIDVFKNANKKEK